MKINKRARQLYAVPDDKQHIFVRTLSGSSRAQAAMQRRTISITSAILSLHQSVLGLYLRSSYMTMNSMAWHGHCAANCKSNAMRKHGI